MSLEKEEELIKCANTSCQQLKRPGAEFLRHPATKERVCRACWQYYYNKGKDREVKRRNEQHETNCANTFCNKLFYPRQLRPHPATKTMICSACYDYFQRHGRDREVVTIYRKRKEHKTHCGNTLCKILLVPGKIAAHPVTKERICINCCAYYKKYGRDREVVAGKLKKFTEPKARESCANTFCKQQYYPKDLRPHPVTKKKICLVCYCYYKKKGKDRKVIKIIARRVNKNEGFTEINMKKMEKQNNSRTETNQKINITKRTRRSCLKPKPKQALSSSDTSDCEENISDWESENDDTESDDSTSSEESIVDEIEDDFNNVVPNHDTEEDVNEPEEFANSEDQPVSSENPVPRSDTEGATESVLENNFIGKKCNIPSCNSLLPSNKNIFQLPTTGIPVCSDCYKKYLKTEYNRVVDLEETARLTESLSEDLPEIGLEDLTTFFEVVHPGCLTILEDLEKSSKEFLLQKAIDDIFPPMTSESVIWNNLDTYPEYRLYTWTEHETIPFESCSNFLSSFIEDLSKIFPEARISEDSFNHPDFIDDLSSEPSCSPQLNEGIPFNVHKDIESPPNLEIERMFPAENNDEHAVDTEKYLFDHPDFIDGLLSEPSSSPHRCYGADSFNPHRDIETPPILVFEGFFPAENNEDHDVDSEEEQDEASGQELESNKTFSDISSAVQHLWNTYCAPQLTGTTEEGVFEEENSETDWDEEEEEDDESTNGIEEDTTDCYHPLEYNNEPQECDQFSESQEYQYSPEQEFDCYQPGSYNSETDWNQEFVPMYEHLETDQFNTSHTLHCYEPPQTSANNIDKDTTSNVYDQTGYNNETQEIYNSHEYQYSRDQGLDCYQQARQLSDQCDSFDTLHCYEPPQENCLIVYSSGKSTETTLETVSSIPSLEDPDNQANCYKPPQEDVAIIYSFERSAETEFEPVSSIPPSEKPAIQLVYEGIHCSHVPNCYKPSPPNHEWGDILSEYFPNDIENSKLLKSHRYYREKGKDRTPITETKRKMDLKKTAEKHERICSITTHPVTTTEKEVIVEENSEAEEEDGESTKEDTTSNNDNQPNFYHPLGCDNEEFYNSQEHQYSREKELDCYLPGSYNSETDWNQEFVPDFTNNTSHTLHCYEPPQEEVPIIYSTGSLAGTTLETVSSIPSSEGSDTQRGYENIRSCHISNCYEPLQEDVTIIYSTESSCDISLEPVSSISSPFEKQITEDLSIICAEMSSDSSQNEGIPSHKIGCRCKLYENQKCANSACKVTLLPGKNVVNPVTKEKVCLACNDYYKRNGRHREVIRTLTYRRREKHETNCANIFCKRTLLTGKFNVHPLTKEKICNTCYLYYRTTGKDRTSIMENKRKRNLKSRAKKHGTDCGEDRTSMTDTEKNRKT